MQRFEIRRKQSECKQASRMVNEFPKMGDFVVAPDCVLTLYRSPTTGFACRFCVAMVFYEALKTCLSRCTSSVTVKNEAGIRSALRLCGLKCGGDQLGAILSGHFVGNNFARKQVQNHTGITVEFPQFRVGNVTDRNLIGPVRLELLAQDIPFLLRRMKFHAVLLCNTSDAIQFQAAIQGTRKRCLLSIESIGNLRQTYYRLQDPKEYW